MAAVQITGLQALIRKNQMERLRAKAKITEGVRRVVAGVFKDVVTTTPQYSGNLVSNWQIVFGAWGAQYKPIAGYGIKTSTPYMRGDNPAVSNTLDRELWKLDNLRWNSKVRIQNSAPYAEEVEAGEGPKGHDLREENLVGGQVLMAEMTAMKYKFNASAVGRLIRGL